MAGLMKRHGTTHSAFGKLLSGGHDVRFEVFMIPIGTAARYMAIFCFEEFIGSLGISRLAVRQFGGLLEALLVSLVAEFFVPVWAVCVPFLFWGYIVQDVLMQKNAGVTTVVALFATIAAASGAVRAPLGLPCFKRAGKPVRSSFVFWLWRCSGVVAILCDDIGGGALKLVVVRARLQGVRRWLDSRSGSLRLRRKMRCPCARDGHRGSACGWPAGCTTPA